ncbi:hypothetical protein TNCV_2567021 [Trichonephila clavipes]|uniref:Uncharacterized protein n=1 Tax=Trichonephila clavipes TaxID=2585209 RepID=A0A8X6WKR8_TRICX|nr:hypothetical protein TNCV_2567021 [Trichonephila clavipes]
MNCCPSANEDAPYRGTPARNTYHGPQFSSCRGVVVWRGWCRLREAAHPVNVVGDVTEDPVVEHPSVDLRDLVRLVQDVAPIGGTACREHMQHVK